MPSGSGSGGGAVGGSSRGPAVNSEAVREAWRTLFRTLVSLRGDPKIDSIIVEKHAELKEMLSAKGGPRPTPVETDEVQRWFVRKLKAKSTNCEDRVTLCRKLMEKVKKGGTAWRLSETSRIEEALRERLPDEGPLICGALQKELEGSRFEDLWICREGPGVYRLGEEEMRVAVQVLDGKLLIHGYFEGELLHPVRVAIQPFLQEHGPKELRSATDADCDLFGGGGGDAAQRAGRSRSPRRSGVEDSDSSLPPGWVRKASRSKPGVFYYANEAKSLTQFERPSKA